MAIGKFIGSYTKEYGQLRFIVQDDRLLVCATDIARSLGYKRPGDAVREHCCWAEKHTVPKMDGGREFARFVSCYAAIEFVRHCCLPGADEYGEFLQKLIYEYQEKYVSCAEDDGFDFGEEDNYDDEDEEDDDNGPMDGRGPDFGDAEYDKETEILAVTKFVVLLVGMIIDVLYDGGWFAFNSQKPEAARQKSEIASGLMRMMDIADEVLDGMFDEAQSP